MSFKNKSKIMVSISLILALFLVIGASAIGAYATPAMNDSSPTENLVNTLAEDVLKEVDIPYTAFTNKEYDKLLALQFDGYTSMSVADYREKACSTIDAEYPDYMYLLDRMYQDRQLSNMRYSNETASFLNNTLFPLIFDNWLEVNFRNYAEEEGGRIEYLVTRTILAPDQLTVGEHDRTIRGIMDNLQTFIESKSNPELQDESGMNIAIKSEIECLINEWETEALKLDIRYVYTPLELFKAPSENTTSKIKSDDERGTPGSREDYNSLLTLKTSDYKSQSIADFNASLFKWANENEVINNRIVEDLAKDDIRVSLTDEELTFLTLTVSISNAQNANMVRSENTGKPKTDLKIQYRLTTNEDPYVWLLYHLVIKISNEKELTIGERDRYLSNIIYGMQTLWSDKNFDELVATDEKVFKEKLNLLVSQNSNNSIKIEVNDFCFNTLDERSLANR